MVLPTMHTVVVTRVVNRTLMLIIYIAILNSWSALFQLYALVQLVMSLTDHFQFRITAIAKAHHFLDESFASLIFIGISDSSWEILLWNCVLSTPHVGISNWRGIFCMSSLMSVWLWQFFLWLLMWLTDHNSHKWIFI